MNPKRIAALIPALNEGEHLKELIPQVKKYIPDVIVVDDGSSDNTSEVAIQAGAHLLRHPKNRGKGEALRTGFHYLLGHGFEGCLILDGDGQHHPEDIPSFLSFVDHPEVGVVVGDRMGEPLPMPFVRRWTNRLMSFILSKLLGEKIPDTQCGFRYFQVELLRRADFMSSRYAIESELLIEAKRHGFKIRSVPVRTIYKDQKSGIRPIRDTYYFLRLLFRKRNV